MYRNAPVRGLVFDKDGTLFDFMASWAAWTAGFLTDVAQRDRILAEQLAKRVGFRFDTHSYATDSIVIGGTPTEIAQRLLPALPNWDQAALVEHMASTASHAKMVPAADLPLLLDALTGAGLKLGLATNDIESIAKTHLQDFGIASAFDFVAGCDSGYGAKPQPGQLLAFAKAVSLPPSDIVMIGDSRHDLAAGRAAGMRTIGVLTGPSGRDALTDLADDVLGSIKELTNLFQIA